ncbi:MAG: hypothetical protein CMA89_00030 [Euryarchaeota archaeon]|nr:hypothetical protein [Euryarchaeota archaeon]|tara:strand:- start:4218 stop:4832 length:615 start_codon:yes stop_codon:yes gene_type:complete
MHKAAVALLIVGILGLLLSSGTIFGGREMAMDEFEREFETKGDDLWEGTTYSSFEGRMTVAAFYPVFIEETRDAEVTLVGEDENSRFIPCDESRWCHHDYQEDGERYRLLGHIEVAESGDWEVRFSGDVTGGSKVMIREASILNEGAIIAGIGCFGSVASCCMILLGAILAFTLKSGGAGDSRVSLDSGFVSSNDDETHLEQDS